MVTKTTTNCDKCGGECVNGCVRVRASTEHWTSQRIEVGEDYYEPLELCLTCGEAAVRALGMKFEKRREMAHEERLDVPSAPIEIAPGVELVRRLPRIGTTTDECGPVMERSHP